jgi:hypothetical protein
MRQMDDHKCSVGHEHQVTEAKTPTRAQGRQGIGDSFAYMFITSSELPSIKIQNRYQL